MNNREEPAMTFAELQRPRRLGLPIIAIQNAGLMSIRALNVRAAKHSLSHDTISHEIPPLWLDCNAPCDVGRGIALFRSHLSVPVRGAPVACP